VPEWKKFVVEFHLISPQLKTEVSLSYSATPELL
jgi:hypothetical protein